MHDAIRISESARKADYVTGQHIRCLFDVFEASNKNKPETLKSCDELSVETTKYDLRYPPVPAEESCKPEENQPGDGPWIKLEYSSLDAPQQESTPCPKPPSACKIDDTSCECFVERDANYCLTCPNCGKCVAFCR